MILQYHQLINLLRLIITIGATCVICMSCSTFSGVESQTISTLPFTKDKSCFSGTYEELISDTLTTVKTMTEETARSLVKESEFNEHKNKLNCWFIKYEVESQYIGGIYIEPKKPKAAKLPVIIINRGGNNGFGKWMTYRMFLDALPLAQEGYIVIGTQHRGTHNQSLNPKLSKPLLRDEFGGKDVNDILALFDIIDRLPLADSEQIGMYGQSRGGMLAYQVAAITDRLSAIAVKGSPSDLQSEMELRPNMENVYRARIPDYDTNKEEELRKRSSIHNVEKLEPELPVLILHGQDDSSVSLDSALSMTQELTKHKHPVKLIVYPMSNHSLMRNKRSYRPELYRWFNQYLTKKE